MKIEILPVLVLNPHSRCNCRCTMCDIWKTTKTRELSDLDLQRQLESIKRLQVQWVVLSGGEPMMHTNLWPLCAMLRDLKVRITLLSSGLLLERYAQEIVAHVDDVIVSLDGPPEVHDSTRGIRGAFHLLSAGVARIRALSPSFPISARSTVQRSNFGHLLETAAAARNLGVDSISFLAADLESTAFHRPEGWPIHRQNEVGLGARDIAILEAQIQALIETGECNGFVAESPEKLRRIVRHFRAHLKQTTPIAPACNAPWTSAVVEADGSVRPCFFHPPIGHLSSGLALDEILNSPAALAFRESLNVANNPVCRKCVCSLNWNESNSSAPHAKVAIQ